MPVLVKAIYKHGVFEPEEPIEGLMDNQQVQLQVWPATVEQVAPAEEPAFWFDPDGDAEWASLSPREQQGGRAPILSEEDRAARMQWIEGNSGVIQLPSDQILEIAMADWLLEENLPL